MSEATREAPYAASFGYSLAMAVLQSNVYHGLTDRARAECDELIERGCGRAPAAPAPGATAEERCEELGRKIDRDLANYADEQQFSPELVALADAALASQAVPESNSDHSGTDCVVRLAPLDAWQPIASAPKDGTLFLGHNAERDATYLIERVHVEYDRKTTWCDRAGYYQITLTHWMPLPPPPGSADNASPKPNEKSPVPALQEGERDAARDAVCRAAKWMLREDDSTVATPGWRALREALAALEALEQQDGETR